jgi:hypothetical protein
LDYVPDMILESAPTDYMMIDEDKSAADDGTE